MPHDTGDFDILSVEGAGDQILIGRGVGRGNDGGSAFSRNDIGGDHAWSEFAFAGDAGNFQQIPRVITGEKIGTRGHVNAGALIGENNGMGILEVVNGSIHEKVARCIIDISGLRYINSSGIGVLITILTKFRNKGGEVYLMKPSESVQKLLVITKLNAIFQMVQSEEEVLQLAKK